MIRMPSVRDMADRQDRTTLRTGLPRLMGIGEIRARTGWSRQWTTNIVGQKGFPDPVYEMASGRLWLASEVEGWLRVNKSYLVEEPDGT